MSITQDTSRRGFLKGATLAVGATAFAATAGMMTGCSGGASSSNNGYEWEDEADVIVIGGGTGAMNAIKVVEAGASCILLEKCSTFTGDTALSGGVVTAAESCVQKEKGGVDARTGQPDTKEQFYADWLETDNLGVESDLNPDLVWKIVDHTPDMVQFFVDRGVKFNLYQSGEHPVERGHRPSEDNESGAFGIRLCEPMIAEMEKVGVNAINNTRATHILRDEDENIIGVQCRTSEGDIVNYGCKAVILATGGQGANKEMTAKYNMEAINWINIGGDFGTGDGIIMAEELGAQFCGFKSWLDPIRSKLTSGAVLGTNMVDLGIMITEIVHAGPVSTVIVDPQTGKRFTNEDRGYPNGIMSMINRSDTGSAYRIFDSQLFDQATANVMVNSLEPAGGLEGLLEKGFARQANTIEELAEQLKIDPATLKKTIDDYNALVDAGVDTEFGRRPESLAKIEKAPFYAWTIVSANATPGAGASISIKVNENCEVLDLDNHVIPGLYAVGAISSHNVFGWGYLGSGTGVMIGICEAYFVGPQAAEYAQSRA